MSDAPADDGSGPASDDTSRVRSLGAALTGHASDRLDDLRARMTVADTGWHVYERDKDAGGTLLGSALALRLFVFFVPLVLLVLGIAGVLGRHGGVDSASSTLQITGKLAVQIDEAFAQGTITPWPAVLIGLFGVATGGRSLTRALVLSSALSWNMGGSHKMPVRVIGIVVGLLVSISLLAIILNLIREAAGGAVAGVSFVLVAVAYAALWSLLFLALPRGTTDPAAALPGALVIAVVLTGLQAVTQLYLPNRISGASSIYGSMGVAVIVFGWFFIIGRVLAFSFALNAVIYERLGSASRFFFGLPGLRRIRDRIPAVARFFDLEHEHRPEGADRTARGGPVPPGS